MTPEKRTEFFYIDMSNDLGLADGKEIDGMAAGEFVDMWGTLVEIDKLDQYVAHTTENLEATRTEGGELVGLPIDASGHDNGDGAGWIVGVRQVGDVVRFAVKWTEIGLELIQKGIRRFFSPTIDTKNRVILGGSLTNWPATRTKRGKILLRPIELSEQILEVELPEEVTLLQRIYDQLSHFVDRITKADRPESETNLDTEESMKYEDLTPEQIAELQVQVLAQLSSNPPAELTALIDAEAGRRMTAMLEAEQRKAHVAEFAARVVGGEEGKPVGLPVEQEKLVSFLTSLSGDQQKAAEEILSAIHEKAAIDFQEQGHNKRLSGLVELPEYAKPLLKDWVDRKLSIEAFFAANAAEFGEMSDYNLSEYKETK